MAAESHTGCVILGAGGHAQVLIDCLERLGIAICALLDHDASRWGGDLFGVPILGGDDLLADLARRGADSFVVGVGSVGDARLRRRLFELGQAHLPPLTLVHPSATCSTRAVAGPGAQVLPGSIVNAGARLGSNVIVNSGAIVEHDCSVGDHAHIASGAILAGGVQVGAGALVGAGATIRQGIAIGEGAIVGAGAVVVRDVPPHTLVIGVPARPSGDLWHDAQTGKAHR